MIVRRRSCCLRAFASWEVRPWLCSCHLLTENVIVCAASAVEEVSKALEAKESKEPLPATLFDGVVAAVRCPACCSRVVCVHLSLMSGLVAAAAAVHQSTDHKGRAGAAIHAVSAVELLQEIRPGLTLSLSLPLRLCDLGAGGSFTLLWIQSQLLHYATLPSQYPFPTAIAWVLRLTESHSLAFACLQ